MRTFFENTSFVAAEMYRVEYHETMEQRDRDARRHTLLMYLTQAVQEAEAKPGAVQSVDAEGQYTRMFQPGGRWDQLKDKPKPQEPKPQGLTAEEIFNIINEPGV